MITQLIYHRYWIVCEWTKSPNGSFGIFSSLMEVETCKMHISEMERFGFFYNSSSIDMYNINSIVS